MFENGWQMSPPSSWNSLINQKRQSFKLQIRNRQIDQYKTIVRQKYNLIINYSNPHYSISQVKSAIAKKQYKLTYIINTVSNLMDNFCICRILAQEKVVEMLLIAITDLSVENYDNYNSFLQQKNTIIQFWIDLLVLTTQNWPDIWIELYQQTPQILWTILVQNQNNKSICLKIRNLLNFWMQRYKIQNCPQDQDLLFLLKQQFNLCPIMLEIIGEHMNLKIQQTLESNNLILTNIQYLQSPQHIHSYIYLLSKIGFVDKTILQLIFKKLYENKIPDKRLAIKVLFQQMYFTEDQVYKIQQLDNQCKEIAYQMLNDDF